MDHFKFSVAIVQLLVLTCRTDARMIHDSGSHAEVCSGADLLLNWIHDGPDQVASIAWYKDSTLIMNQTTFGGFSVKEGADVEHGFNGQIILKTVEPTDADKYSIEIDYFEGSGRTDVTATTTVLVLVPPTGLSGSSSVSSGDNTFTCTVTTAGTPAATVLIKVDGVLQSSASMIVNAINSTVDCCVEGGSASCLPETCASVYPPTTTSMSSTTAVSTRPTATSTTATSTSAASTTAASTSAVPTAAPLECCPLACQVGIGVGAGALVIVVVILILCLCRRNRKMDP